MVCSSQGSHSHLFPGDGLSLSFGERCDVAGTGRDAVEGQSEGGRSVYVRLHYRDTACNSNLCCVDRKAGCYEWTKDSITARLRCASHSRSSLYPYTRCRSAIAIQTLDGVANAIFGIVSILVVKDRTQGTGRFNVAAGCLATMVGIGAALSTTIGGVLIQHLGYRASFLG